MATMFALISTQLRSAMPYANQLATAQNATMNAGRLTSFALPLLKIS